MKLGKIRSCAARLVLLALPVTLVAGCPMNPTDVSGLDVHGTTYWVEFRDGALCAFALPAERGDEGSWLTLGADTPEWYTGPALYALDIDGTWQRLTQDEDLTLDEVLQLHDPPPATASTP